MAQERPLSKPQSPTPAHRKRWGLSWQNGATHFGRGLCHVCAIDRQIGQIGGGFPPTQNPDSGIRNTCSAGRNGGAASPARTSKGSDREPQAVVETETPAARAETAAPHLHNEPETHHLAVLGG
jgi:hypothetical protein